MMKIERVPVRKIFRKVYETKETVLQENAYCCIYIEGNI